MNNHIPTHDELRIIVATMLGIDSTEVEDVALVFTTKNCDHAEHDHGGLGVIHTFCQCDTKPLVAFLDEIAGYLETSTSGG